MVCPEMGSVNWSSSDHIWTAGLRLPNIFLILFFLLIQHLKHIENITFKLRCGLLLNVYEVQNLEFPPYIGSAISFRWGKHSSAWQSPFKFYNSDTFPPPSSISIWFEDFSSKTELGKSKSAITWSNSNQNISTFRECPVLPTTIYLVEIVLPRTISTLQNTKPRIPFDLELSHLLCIKDSLLYY